MWTVDEILKATGGTSSLAGSLTLSNVSIDSRKLAPGSLFLAFKGERLDGHEYIKSALESGASAALVHRIPEGLPKDAPLIVVEDTYKALVDMAKASRRRTKGKIIAVTGSVGKTSTKEAIRTVLASSGSVYATLGNLNNHIGLPLSLCNLSADMDFGVFELGMNHAGEISYLTNILHPDIAIITNVEAVHLEFFAGIEGIADAKGEIMEGLTKDGTIILNRDNPHYARLLAKAHGHGIRHIMTFGEHPESTCRLTNYALTDSGVQIDAVINNTPLTFHLGATGRHWAHTALAALAASTAAGVVLKTAAAALAGFHEPEGRGKVINASLPQGDVSIIDDCYNASPVSMNAAIAKLAELQAHGKAHARKIAVLGDMLELGPTTAELHKSLLSALERHKIDKVYASGATMKHLYDTLPLPMRGAYAENATALSPLVTEALQANDIILIKGSHGSRMDIVRDAIVKQAADSSITSPKALLKGTH
ncbi:MAG TPA: UDP-N-acetylmuramoyl-tripeptide--D-alanyl-D-alanine ligase [Rickettsiales bacterium]|nr:UDP-N-acetylmuramoyl-tripeptide--D-alanyl-D-alanine ligase [Rickettsiales bacterium]